MQQLVWKLPTIQRPAWEAALAQWHQYWADFLREKTYHLETGRWQYTHRRLRSASQSLHGNTPYLFTYLEHPELSMPNTTNSLEGCFSNLRSKLLIHAGLRRERIHKLTNYILSK
ncbi:MAG: hypothetical protein K9N46_11310 [Candidatus Marinimicrobia bacterium]|nr:hypothetical protein [Candidatus Neomarinimicrobiota bacterium]MCF7827629.1 hypothetical protein [Candidatus Neomarinimicrobiota bacterium]MCF7881316.1 hypothetical protein [Candidatus Neomarinimicrobiota bacterium]